MDHTQVRVDESFSFAADVQVLVEQAVAPHRDMLGHVVGRAPAPLDRATSPEASMDNVLLDAIARVSDTPLAFSNGWRCGAPSSQARSRLSTFGTSCRPMRRSRPSS